MQTQRSGTFHGWRLAVFLQAIIWQLTLQRITSSGLYISWYEAEYDEFVEKQNYGTGTNLVSSSSFIQDSYRQDGNNCGTYAMALPHSQDGYAGLSIKDNVLEITQTYSLYVTRGGFKYIEFAHPSWGNYVAEFDTRFKKKDFSLVAVPKWVQQMRYVSRIRLIHDYRHGNCVKNICSLEVLAKFDETKTCEEQQGRGFSIVFSEQEEEKKDIIKLDTPIDINYARLASHQAAEMCKHVVFSFSLGKDDVKQQFVSSYVFVSHPRCVHIRGELHTIQFVGGRSIQRDLQKECAATLYWEVDCYHDFWKTAETYSAVFLPSDDCESAKKFAVWKESGKGAPRWSVKWNPDPTSCKTLRIAPAENLEVYHKLYAEDDCQTLSDVIRHPQILKMQPASCEK